MCKNMAFAIFLCGMWQVRFLAVHDLTRDVSCCSVGGVWQDDVSSCCMSFACWRLASTCRLGTVIIVFTSVPSHLSRVMSVGDPTVFGNLPPAPNIAAAVKTVIDGGKHSGYGHSRGKPCSLI